MKIICCTDGEPFILDLLASQLSDSQIITSSSDTVSEYLDGVDVVIPCYATIDASIINSGKFGLIQRQQHSQAVI